MDKIIEWIICNKGMIKFIVGFILLMALMVLRQPTASVICII